jgi:hypothetical protein
VFRPPPKAPPKAPRTLIGNTASDATCPRQLLRTTASMICIPDGLGVLAESLNSRPLFATQVNLIHGHRLFKDDDRMAVLT